MTNQSTEDHDGHESEEGICEVCLAHQIASAMTLSFHGMPPSLAYLVLGSLVVGIFSIIEFAEPQHALEEFDNWAKYVRQCLADHKKSQMQ